MKLRENTAVKALAFLAAVAAFTATAIMGWYQIMNFDALWTDANTLGYTCDYLLAKDRYAVERLLTLYERRDAGLELSLAERQDLSWMEGLLRPGKTNLRWQLLRGDGTVLYGNTGEDGAAEGSGRRLFSYTLGKANAVNIGWEIIAWDTVQSAANKGDYDGVYYDDAWRSRLAVMAERAQNAETSEDGAAWTFYAVEQNRELTLDTALMDDSGYTSVLRVRAQGGEYICLPTVRACLEPNRFGFRFDAEGLNWYRDGEAEEAGEAASLTLWIDRRLSVDDQYRRAALTLRQWRTGRTEYLAATVVCGVAGLLLLAYLCCAAGHKRGVEGIYLNWFHRLPGDVLLAAMFLAGVAAVGFGIELTVDAYMDAPLYVQLIFIGAMVSTAAALTMGALITVCARCKARTVFKDTWTWKLCAWLLGLFVICVGKVIELFEGAGRTAQAVPLVWKAAAGCGAYVLFTFWEITSWRYYSSGTLFLWLAVSAAAALYLCRWAYQWKLIRRGAREIIGGNPNYHIDTRRMLPDLRAHADELNNLGQAISTAVDERVKSEHFKAELITNVSHDLKTPLTSIINYVDLLKKEDIGNPTAQGYIEVLDRKSQRLKKLTEDLVEASKASTGSLTVSWERIDWAQLTDQALGECGDRLEGQKLTVVRFLPEEPLWVEADGRHLWRVLDNLLSNCAKYALPGTRVYVDLRRAGDHAVLSVKNISREALDIPAEQLMERFVRGDQSRNLEGSGLGLSIAQSLTELQHGRFEISIDGDLFKAIVTLPLAGEGPKFPPEGGPDEPIRLVL